MVPILYHKLIWINQHGKTPGNHLYDLFYSDNKNTHLSLQKRSFLFGYHIIKSCGIIDFCKRLIENCTITLNIFEIIDKIVKIYSYISMLLFFYKGQYSDFIYRILNVKLLAEQKADISISQVDPEEINRSFIWKELYSSILIFLKDVQFHQIVNTLDSIFNNDQNKIDIKSLSNISCFLCNREIATMPVKSGNEMCKHTFCYFCAEIAMRKGNFICPGCNQIVHKINKL